MTGQLKLLPILIFIAFMSFAVRLVDVVTGVPEFSGLAFAEDVEKTETKDYKEKKNKEEEHKDTNQSVKESDAEEPKWRDASDSDFNLADIKTELYKELADRRKKLDEQEKQLHVKEAMLQATAKELDLKYLELEKLKKELESLLQLQSEKEEERINSLVKVYEGMKPKDAARIFDTLDLDVLVDVIGRMSERKISPVLAAMNPERAKTVTIMLAEQNKLPKIR
ncbi:MAG: flagellar protein FlbB [Alphaproteobacteria bacterium]|nr:flagellar protein FlbB [Alphaproteobacteria bacterium]